MVNKRETHSVSCVSVDQAFAELGKALGILVFG